MRVWLGNKISTLRYWSWRGRFPMLSDDQRWVVDTDASLHPEWFDRLLLKAQDWLWR